MDKIARIEQSIHDMYFHAVEYFSYDCTGIGPSTMLQDID